MIKVFKSGNSFFLEYHLSNKVIGTIYVVKDKDKKSAEIESLVIWEEKNRMKGYGRELITFCINELKRMKINSLKVLPDKDAVKFYERLGFTYHTDNKYILFIN